MPGLGLDAEVVENLDVSRALKRIKKDVQSDFIFAPHVSVVYQSAAEELWGLLSTKLKNGDFQPTLPVTIEVPKASGFGRPGSILGPFERLAYQLTVDEIAPVAEGTLDRSQVFSHVLLEDDEDGFMFEQGTSCYLRFRNKIRDYCESGDYSHVLKADVSSYFERLYQHVLINSLNSAGCNHFLVKFLEKFLLLLTQKDSHGIIQGLLPSDFLGNYYLCSMDAEHQLRGLPFTRYVDDIYIFFESLNSARIHRIELGSLLRQEGLSLNESKTHCLEVTDLIYQETELERMFDGAKEEISSELDRVDFYQSTISWDFLIEDEDQEEEIDELDFELLATTSLFTKMDVAEDARNKIDRFCLPIFAASGSDFALDYVLEKYPSAIHMSQIFAKYLKPFIFRDSNVAARTEKLLNHVDVIFEFQIMWLYAVLMASGSVNRATVNSAINHLRDSRLSPALRAVCAVFVSKFGNAAQRRVLTRHYQAEPSDYVRSAMVYAARYLPSAERNTCFSAWGGHSELNSLVVTAAKNIQSGNN